MGCYFHTCPKCLTPTINNIDTTDADNKRLEFLSTCAELIIIRGCEWKEKKKSLGPIKIFSNFWGRKHSQEEFIQYIKNGTFFGLVKCDIFCPEDARSRWKSINFAPLINRVELDEESISPYMLEICKDKGVKFPLNGNLTLNSYSNFDLEQLTTTFNANNIILPSEVLQWYIHVGLVIKKIHYGIEFKGTVLVLKL